MINKHPPHPFLAHIEDEPLIFLKFISGTGWGCKESVHKTYLLVLMYP